MKNDIIPARFALQQLKGFQNYFMKHVIENFKEFSNACDRNNLELAQNLQDKLKENLKNAVLIIEGKKDCEEISTTFTKEATQSKNI